MSSIAPLERYMLGFICLQGGGLYIQGTATLTNTNVYSNQADGVRSLFLTFIQRPTGVLTVAMCVCGSW